MVKNEKDFTVSVLDENGVIYYGDCDTLFVPSEKEIIAILAHHTPMIAKLSKGDVVIKSNHSKQKLCTINSGLIYVGDNEVTVLANL